MSLREAIDTAARGQEVPAEVLEGAFGEIMDGKATPVGMAALLVALRTMRGASRRYNHSTSMLVECSSGGYRPETLSQAKAAAEKTSN